MNSPSRWHLGILLVLLGFVAAPTPGDIGGCGQQAQQLDARIFYASKDKIDCDRCTDCGLYTSICKTACDPNAELPESFPEGCYPLVHDGEVCIHALNNASCEEYGGFMSDDPQTRDTPTECNFCPVPRP